MDKLEHFLTIDSELKDRVKEKYKPKKKAKPVQKKIGFTRPAESDDFSPMDVPAYAESAFTQKEDLVSWWFDDEKFNECVVYTHGEKQPQEFDMSKDDDMKLLHTSYPNLFGVILDSFNRVEQSADMRAKYAADTKNK
jgi:hypothetical protein